MLNIDKYAYRSRLIGINPIEKFLFTVLTMVVCLAANSIIASLLTLVIMTGVTILKGGVPWRFYFRLMLVPFSFLVIGVVTVAVNITQQPGNLLWSIGILGAYIGVTPNSLHTAAELFLKALGAVSCLYFLCLTTPVVDIISVLRKLKVPEVFLELMNLIYRFIFVLMETAERIYISQSSRLGYSNVVTGYRSFGQLVSTLFIRSYKRSQDLYMALEARCYDGNLNVLEEDFPISWKNILLIVALNILLTATAVFTGGIL